jgi:archaellum component FlaD/FlaE
MLAGEPTESLLKVLSFYEKIGVLDSVASWQLCRTARNLAAHDYDIEYADIADHFNSLKTLTPWLYISALRFESFCREQLGIEAKQADFTTEFINITKIKPAD